MQAKIQNQLQFWFYNCRLTKRIDQIQAIVERKTCNLDCAIVGWETNRPDTSDAGQERLVIWILQLYIEKRIDQIQAKVDKYLVIWILQL